MKKWIEKIELFIDENLHGILGTIVFHLVLILIFLAIRINALRHPEDFQMEILFQEIPEDYKNAEERMVEEFEKEEANLPSEVRRNIAVNVTKNLGEELSTEKYEEQLKKELNIEDYEMPDISDEKLFGNQNRDTEGAEKKPQKEYSGKTRITYSLKNREDLHISIPVYKCEGGGKITVAIEVNQQGRVVKASVVASKVTDETNCLTDAAISAAYKSFFNSDSSAPTRQEGTITYEFVSQ